MGIEQNRAIEVFEDHPDGLGPPIGGNYYGVTVCVLGLRLGVCEDVLHVTGLARSSGALEVVEIQLTGLEGAVNFHFQTERAFGGAEVEIQVGTVDARRRPLLVAC
jgi:hypothetical protein